MSTDKNFLNINLVNRGDPLSVHVHACAVIIVDRKLLSNSSLYFWSPVKQICQGR